jgi:hypothetical protein
MGRFEDAIWERVIIVNGVVLYARDGQLFETMIDCFNAEVDEFPYQDGQFNCVLCC